MEGTAHEIGSRCDASANIENDRRLLVDQDITILRTGAQTMSSKACRILIIDDSADDRANLRQMLLRGSERRYRFTDAELGLKGLKLIADARCAEPDKLPFDCILLDFNLPDIDAQRVLLELCSGRSLPPCPVVVITGWNSMESNVGGKLLRAGAQDYIGKSWTTPESITRAIENAIERFALMTQRNIEMRALSESEARYRNLFDSISDCMCVLERIEKQVGTALDFRCVAINPAFAASYGVSDVVGKSLRQILPNDSEDWFNIYDQVWATGFPAHFESTIPAESRDIEVRAFNIGEPTARKLVLIRNDITQRKESERKLLKLAQTLRDQDSRKDEFLAMLAHELRNPLAPITMAARMLQRPGIDPTTLCEVSAIVSRQAEHMTCLVDDLLDVSRINKGLVTLDHEVLDLNDILANAIEQVRSLIDNKKHKLSVHMTGNAMYVVGDRVRLVQIFANIVTNAAKYTPENGEISVDLSIDGNTHCVIVRDNGVGMSESLLPHVFDIFTQAYRTSDRMDGGLGLGLSLVKRLVGLMDGTVTAHSDGRFMGSTFVVTLPKFEYAPVATTKIVAEVAGNVRGKHVVLVDDNIDAVTILAMLLELEGHTVSVCYAGEQALDLAFADTSISPQVFFLDIGLPGMDGYELARRLRADSRTSNALLVAISGYGQPQDRERSRLAGFNHHVEKPADLSTLLELLNGIPLTSA
jgi:signal transduction histidine kinase/DNA-binding response OmpR family regulator